MKKEKLLISKRPNLLKEWNYEKNGNLQPDSFSCWSHKKVWWKCDKGHEWQTAISLRSRGDNCPFCSGRRVLTGFNDFYEKTMVMNFITMIHSLLGYRLGMYHVVTMDALYDSLMELLDFDERAKVMIKNNI